MFGRLANREPQRGHHVVAVKAFDAQRAAGRRQRKGDLVDAVEHDRGQERALAGNARSGPLVQLARSSSWVSTLAPPAPVLSSTPSTVPRPLSWKPAAKMSVAL